MEQYKYPKSDDWEQLLKRPTASYESLEATVNEIFSEVKNKGNAAVAKYTQLFDGIELDTFQLSQKTIDAAEENVSEALKKAIQLAKENIQRFHTAQITSKITVETTQGVQCWQEKRPIQKVGLYIPGGSAPLFSTVLMLAIPATIAGCDEIVLCTPPNKQGEVEPVIVYTAALCGVTKIFTLGGIQAIAAMTFGTETIPAVYKLFGPGNQFVTVAKQMATKYGVAIDMPAGPSELLVFADDSANTDFVASDLLSQAEHGADSQVVLVTTSEAIQKQVAMAVASQLNDLPRKEIAAKAMANSKSVLVENNEQAIALINAYAPEHFILIATNEDYFLKNLHNAGSVFIGNYTPESAGDYASGTNHTLPTNGYARQYSGVHLDSFMKSMTFQKISEKGLLNIGPAIETMAAAEGLQAHKNSVTLRLKSLRNEE
ncbi:histidinol dehydrogenase [Candidatus Ulvibacter alkanivorans]|uniref:histidinol dehydrogenase n=1 Tax=Candidatus Ulvibacter alkanivorans TaxID=2267620 RepID=UPI000DF15EB8|nr:histidinol dehydrogenase [Candidatus Ulvibacter alkanivorans]